MRCWICYCNQTDEWMLCNELLDKQPFWMVLQAVNQMIQNESRFLWVSRLSQKSRLNKMSHDGHCYLQIRCSLWSCLSPCFLFAHFFYFTHTASFSHLLFSCFFLLSIVLCPQALKQRCPKSPKYSGPPLDVPAPKYLSPHGYHGN